jgi:uncharacterized protein DUF4328
MDFRKLSDWTVRLLYLQVAISAVCVVTGTLEYGVLIDMQEGNFASQADMIQVAEANDTRQAFVGVFQFLIFVVSGIWILRWIYVACSNARDLAAGPMKFSPGWSVGWYFIPILLLWKPYQAMKEIWRVSADPRNPDSVPDSGLLSLWWFFFIVATLSGNASFRLTLRAQEIGELQAANVVTLVSDIASIPLAIALMAIVRRIRDNQEHARATVHAPEPQHAAGATI